MRSLTTTSASWVMLLAAIVLWAAVGYFAWMIYTQEFFREVQMADQEQESRRSAAAVRLHAFVRETNEERIRLDDAARVEIVEMLESIEGVGRDANVPIKIGQAVSTPSPDPRSNVRSFGFIVEAEGSFAKVVRAAALFESLPKPSFVDELQFEMLPLSASGSKKSAGNVWHLVVRIRFISTADISS